MSRIGHLLFELLELVGHLLTFRRHRAGLTLKLRCILATQRTAQTVLEIALLAGELVGLLDHAVELASSVLILHAVQDVARFLQTLRGALLIEARLLRRAVLLRLGVSHVVGSALQSLDGVLQLRTRSGTRLPGIALPSRLTIGLLARRRTARRLLAVRLLARLALIALLGLIAALELLHLPFQLFCFTPQHLLLPALAEGLLLIFLLLGQLLLPASQFLELLQRVVDLLGARIAGRLPPAFVLVLFAVELEVSEIL